jgi:hypothetical protein
MRPVTPTEREMPASTGQPRPTNPYYLTPEARDALKRRAAEIRADLAWKRALRQAKDSVAQTRKPLP